MASRMSPSRFNRIVFRNHTLFLLIALASATGCHELTAHTGLSEFITDRGGAADNSPSPTDEQCAEFAKQFQANVLAQDLSAINNSINWGTLLDRSLAGIPVSAAAKKKFLEIIRSEMDKPSSATARMVEDIGMGGNYHHLRTRTVDGETRLLFRHVPGGENVDVDYQDIVVAKDPQGKLEVVDVYSAMSAEFWSTTWRRYFLPSVAKKIPIQNLTTAENDYVKHFDRMLQVNLHYASGQFLQAENLYSALPPSLKQNKSLLLLRLMAAAQFEIDAYVETVDDFCRYHPNDPCLDLISINVLVHREQYAKAMQCIDRLDEAVGGDPFLNVLRSNVLFEKGEHDAARTLAETAIRVEPQLPDAYWLLLNIAVMDKEHDQTLRCLNLMKNNNIYEFEDLTQYSEFGDFLKTPQFQEWTDAQ